MSLRRRDLLRSLSALGLAPLLPSVVACGGTESEGLPDYAWDGPLGPESMFEHGVASGDPLVDGVVLWTRASVPDGEFAEVFVEVALDPDFLDRVIAEYHEATANRDYTLKLDVSGLEPGTTYYYRFQCQGRTSPVGRTRTASEGNLARLRLAVFSCSNYAQGYFHAYAHAAAQADLDAALHLGDYIYEYGDGEYGDLRPLDPPTEILTLEDYRRRYSLNRKDEDLQAVHRQHPFITVWDDHESANDAYKDGAENHDDSEGAWPDRLGAARKAYAEWMPYREGTEGQIYRRLQFGDLVDLFMLDTRIHGRDRQAQGPSDTDTIGDESRTLLGDDQEAWLLEGLSNSTARWRILGQQVVMTQLLLSGGTVPNVDQWDGYPGARRRLLQHIVDEGIENVVVLTGDIHSSWASEVPIDIESYDPETSAGSTVVEFVTPAVSSPGASFLESLVGSNPNIKLLEGSSNGYMIIDVTSDRVQADWYWCSQEQSSVPGETLEYGVSYAVASGTATMSEVSGPAPRVSEAPRLAPGSTDRAGG